MKEPWLVLRGEALEQCGRLAEARVVFQQAVRGIEGYAVFRRGLPATQQLETRSREEFKRLEAKLAGETKATKGPAS